MSNDEQNLMKSEATLFELLGIDEDSFLERFSYIALEEDASKQEYIDLFLETFSPKEMAYMAFTYCKKYQGVEHRLQLIRSLLG